MKIPTPIYLLLIMLCACSTPNAGDPSNDSNILVTLTKALENRGSNEQLIHPSGTSLKTRISPPDGFSRTKESTKSFAEYLRNLPLKPHGAEVKLFDGRTKPNRNVYVAVVDMKIGKKDLHQCADAVMRLRAEYLWKQGLYEDIHFNLTNGFRVDYSEWMKGKRIAVNGNKTSWVEKAAPSNTYQTFWQYMELVFSYAGTLSLSKELAPVKLDDMEIGDVFIYGGSPGHAVLVVDIAQNPENNEKIFLLAQSYMPAQETQILNNPNNRALSPWYSLDDIDDELKTPEWTFDVDELMRFK